jgi:ATP-dependent DNA helicase RecG
MPVSEFASSRPLEREALAAAPVRYPRPSRLAAPLAVDGQKAEQAAAALGLTTVGELLEHLPRDRREARAVAALVPGETATVLVEVRAIASRPVRRRGMRPLVEATVADETGPMKATFFNQPWLARKYPSGTRLMLHGKFEARNRFRVQAHAPTAGATGGSEAVAHYPATDGLTSTQILALVRAHAGELRNVVEPLPGPATSPILAPTRTGPGNGSPSRSCCWSSWPCFAGARLGGRPARRPRSPNRTS